MASKQNIMYHLDGINACEAKEFEHALGLFGRISEPSAPICFNMGTCHLRLNNHTEALQMFQLCVHKDRYLAVGHFQLGISETLCGNVAAAISSFQAAYDALRGNAFIDYRQLNMSCKLYACEISFNLGLLYLFSGNTDQARDAMYAAAGLPSDNTRHASIPESISAMEAEQWDYFGRSTVDRLIYLPENSFFRVSKAKIEGLKTSTKFMDSAKVVAAAKDEYSFVGFVGAKKVQATNPAVKPPPSSPNKRPSPPAGPPPSVPPPRLPKGSAPQSRAQPMTSPKPSNAELPLKLSPRRASPSRPPPPSMPAPKTVNKPPALPNARKQGPATDDRSTNKPSLNHASSNIFSELKKSMNNANLETPVSPKSTSNNHQNAFTSTKSQNLELECRFKLKLDANALYNDLLTKLAERLSHASSDLGNSLLRKSMTLTVDDPVRKTKVQVSSNANWQTAWSSVTKNRPYKVKLALTEESKESSTTDRVARPPPTNSAPTRSASPGYKPSRPAPVPQPPVVTDNDGDDDDEIYRDNEFRSANDQAEQEDIYHDIS